MNDEIRSRSVIHKNRRGQHRMASGDPTVAWLDPLVRANVEDFEPTIPALVLNESTAGCGVVILCNHELREHQKLTIQVGDEKPVRAEIRWVDTLDKDVHKVGFHYLWKA